MNRKEIQTLKTLYQLLGLYRPLDDSTQKRSYLSGLARLAYGRATPQEDYTDLPVSGEVIDEIALHADMLTIGEDMHQAMNTVTLEHNKKDQGKTRGAKT